MSSIPRACCFLIIVFRPLSLGQATLGDARAAPLEPLPPAQAVKDAMAGRPRTPATPPVTVICRVLHLRSHKAYRLQFPRGLPSLPVSFGRPSFCPFNRGTHTLVGIKIIAVVSFAKTKATRLHSLMPFNVQHVLYHARALWTIHASRR